MSSPQRQFPQFKAALTPNNMSANSVGEQTFNVPGLYPGDVVIVTPPSSVGVGLGYARVSAANTLALMFVNPTGSPVTPAAGIYTITVIR